MKTIFKKMKNNKGFTLVELIIVVAIIAVLASVLAPQYLSYVERAKETNDLQVATTIARAATAAIADPINDIPPGQIVEILWITGEESGAHVTRGSILIRHNDDYRKSIFNDGKNGDDVPTTDGDVSTLERFAASVFGVMGGADRRIQDDSDWLQMEFEDASSKIGNEANFALHINSSTGEIALAGSPTDANINRWIDLGLDVEPYIY